MDERARAGSRRGWAAAGVVALAGGPLIDCSGTGKPANDSFNSGDSSLPHFEASTPEAMGPPIDAGSPPRDSTSDAASDATADSLPADSAGLSETSLGDGTSCLTGQTFCGGGCVDTKTDRSNCGQCSNACLTGVDCINGLCACATDAGQALCNNTCVSLPTDPNNCGACGHSCQGSTCANSLCQPTVVAQLVSGGGPIYDIAVDSAYVYWTQIAINSSNGIVSKKPYAGSTTTLSLTMDPYMLDPRGIAVDNHNMYWVNVGNGAVEALDLMTDNHLVLRNPMIDAGVGMSDSPYDIASDGQDVYWTAYGTGEIIREPIGAGESELIHFAGSQNHPIALALDATNVYWVNFGDANSSIPSGSVMQMPKGAPDAGAPDAGVILSLAQTEDQPWDIAVDDSGVYWTNHTNPGQVKKVPIGGGQVVTLASGQGTPYGIAIDANYVYWTNFDDKNVMRLPKASDAGAPQPFALAANQNTPSAIAVDAKNVYWADPGAGTILKVAK